MHILKTTHAKKASLREQFLGDEHDIISATSAVINNFISAEYLEVAYPEDRKPEEHGKLYLFPIDDNKFCLELFYLQYGRSGKSNASVCYIQIMPQFFEQYPPETLMANQPFRFDRTTDMPFPVCTNTVTLLEQLKVCKGQTPFLHSLQQTHLIIQLLRCAIECMTIPYEVCQTPACRFLAYESEREKIADARTILENNISNPLTIRELARKVAMNECYLKKGFKAITGKTIHDYQQELRITKAKELLGKERMTVTYVADTLGYSSISHFSTAFKRITGMKPCELLS